MLATASQAFENVHRSSEILSRHRDLRERAPLAQGAPARAAFLAQSERQQRQLVAFLATL
jgi:hypothetical protein